MYVEDTIAAISTPVGEGGIGVVRVSGPHAEVIAGRVFKGKAGGGSLESHRLYYGRLVDPADDKVIDEVMLVLMRAPRSYTREDVCEIHCHGGYLVTCRVLDLLVAQGARLADPGEFTRRAFLNGRIDLVQAEAIIEVIRSKTDAALNLAQHQREGQLSRALDGAREQVSHALALVEAYIDFPEDDIGEERGEEVRGRVTGALSTIGNLLQGYAEGKVLRDGVAVMIAGKPNVGKSSLLNTLLQEKRAIVTAIPGTTRDIIEEVVNIKGLPVRLLDTAGIRVTDDPVEREGISIALERIEQADLVLFLLDNSRQIDDDDLMLLQQLQGRNFLIVQNKVDLPGMLTLPELPEHIRLVQISTRTGAGIDELKEVIFQLFIHGRSIDSRDFVAISQVRHRDALQRAELSLHRFTANMEAGLSLELLAVDLKDGLDAIGEVTGETTTDEILDLIFQRFCIGK